MADELDALMDAAQLGLPEFIDEADAQRLAQTGFDIIDEERLGTNLVRERLADIRTGVRIPTDAEMRDPDIRLARAEFQEKIDAERARAKPPELRRESPNLATESRADDAARRRNAMLERTSRTGQPKLRLPPKPVPFEGTSPRKTRDLEARNLRKRLSGDLPPRTPSPVRDPRISQADRISDFNARMRRSMLGDRIKTGGPEFRALENMRATMFRDADKAFKPSLARRALNTLGGATDGPMMRALARQAARVGPLMNNPVTGAIGTGLSLLEAKGIGDEQGEKAVMEGIRNRELTDEEIESLMAQMTSSVSEPRDITLSEGAIDMLEDDKARRAEREQAVLAEALLDSQ
jgi:hypothetical protein